MIKGMAGCGFMALDVGAQGYSAAVSGGGLIYQQLSTETYSTFNWNSGVDDRYAFSFVATGNGTPTSLTIYSFGISGGASSSCDFYIKNDKTLAATTFGQSLAFSVVAGTNLITLTGGSAITAGNTYRVFIRRQSASAYPQFQYKFTGATQNLYRAAALASDPTTLVGATYDLAMILQ